ncbi:MAG: hypothetical protein V2I33_09190 [Kangiellaceae bacterium]|jgi:uncharacterized membrane protein YkoI|nr:hypothetical protein [Kangiellaceae bacterium]
MKRLVFASTIILTLISSQVFAKQCQPIAKASVIKQLKQKNVAKTLSIKLQSDSGTPVYTVKQLLKSGRVRVITINACTGKRI